MIKPFINTQDPIHWLACGFGSGLSPWMPGTIGTLAAVPIWFALQKLSIAFYLVFVAIAWLVGNVICDKTARDVGVHDHGGIVWDEFVGFWIAMIAVPATWKHVVVGFLLFRFFDIVKPFPIAWLDKHIDGGAGIMIDDVVAGVYALVVIHFLMQWQMTSVFF